MIIHSEVKQVAPQNTQHRAGVPNMDKDKEECPVLTSETEKNQSNKGKTEF
jgi:hypothetical protein